MMTAKLRSFDDISINFCEKAIFRKPILDSKLQRFVSHLLMSWHAIGKGIGTLILITCQSNQLLPKQNARKKTSPWRYKLCSGFANTGTKNIRCPIGISISRSYGSGMAMDAWTSI